MRAMFSLKLGKCQSIAELKVSRAFRLFFSHCLGSFYVSFTILFGSCGAQGLLISPERFSWMFFLTSWCIYCDFWFAAIKLLWLWTKKSILMGRSCTICSTHFCIFCLFFIYSGGFWFTECLWNKCKIEASLAKMLDPVRNKNSILDHPSREKNPLLMLFHFFCRFWKRWWTRGLIADSEY